MRSDLSHKKKSATDSRRSAVAAAAVVEFWIQNMLFIYRFPAASEQLVSYFITLHGLGCGEELNSVGEELLRRMATDKVRAAAATEAELICS